MLTLAELGADIRAGRTSAVDLLEASLARAEDPNGEGGRAFLKLSAGSARATAESVDRLREAEVPLPPLAGIPISLKDLFDVQGETTAAGSKVLASAPPAERDATVVQRLRAAGAVFVGRTNMTEFAYSGVGLNPHFGTPLNPHDRTTGRIPGGSSSGAAVSVTDGMAAAGIGTDTGGSCRIPAALCGLTGFKPTARRIPMNGVLPLSTSLDSVGAIARTVRCVSTLDAIMAGTEETPLTGPGLDGLRLLVVPNVLLDDVDEATAHAFDNTLKVLSSGGARVTERRLSALDLLPSLAEKGGLVAAEAHAWHRDLLADRAGEYDPRVRQRIEAGETQGAADYIRALRARQEFQTKIGRALAEFDAIVAPTTPLVAPRVSEFDNDEDFGRLNRLLLRNPTVANMMDGCSISIPCQEPGALPVGLMLIAKGGTDRKLLAIAAAIEAVLQG